MRQPLDYAEVTMFDLIAELPAWVRIAVYLVAAFLMAAMAFMVGYVMAAFGG